MSNVKTLTYVGLVILMVFLSVEGLPKCRMACWDVRRGYGLGDICTVWGVAHPHQRGRLTVHGLFSLTFVERGVAANVDSSACSATARSATFKSKAARLFAERM